MCQKWKHIGLWSIKRYLEERTGEEGEERRGEERRGGASSKDGLERCLHESSFDYTGMRS
jgi:hypothetical protein